MKVCAIQSTGFRRPSERFLIEWSCHFLSFALVVAPLLLLDVGVTGVRKKKQLLVLA